MFSIESLRGATPPVQPKLATGVPGLDEVLGGGLRLGQLAEISGAPGAGRSSLALSIGLRCLALGQSVVWIESTPAFWPLPSLEAGLPLDQLLLVRVAPHERLRALQLLLSSPGAAAVAVVDLGPPRSPEGSGLRRRAGRGLARPEIVPHQLVKLHRLAERSATLVLFLTERPPEAASLGLLIDVRLHLKATPKGQAADLFERNLDVQVLRHKQGPSQGSFSEVMHGPDRLRLRSTL